MEYLCALAVGIVFFIAGVVIKRQLLFKQRGWEILPVGRDQIKYVEQGTKGIVFYAELMGRGPVNRVIYVPNAEVWNISVPDWARGRRGEILARMKTVLPESKNEYQDA